ncbi:MAG TPA: hypothetical protein PLL10_05530 [Elusimicrobiales bacterium]|nr:hypothetical protein [Elusimicrobiales bacterium]
MTNAAPLSTALPRVNAVNRLLETPAFSHGKKSEQLFVAAMREAARVHYRSCREFRGIWRSANFSPDKLRRPADVARIPFIFVSAFKERSLETLARSQIVLELTSSGTSGQKSRMLLDKQSLLRVRRLAWQVFNGLGLADLSATADSLCFTYDPDVAKNLGTAFTDKLLTGMTRIGEVFYALRWDSAKKDFFFDMDSSIAALERFERSGRQTRVIGFPAHALMLCEEFRKRHGRAARLSPDSWVITGGGWKDNKDKAVDKSLMRARIAHGLGLGAERVRDLFGMVEHGVPYVDCKLGNFHVPVYGKVLVRHPATLELLPYGKTGLLQFITPYLSSYPSISLLSSDFGSLSPRCRCGLTGEVLHIQGRAGVTKLKGCAVSAAELLKK